MDIASVVKSIQYISFKAFHTVTDWRCDHPGLPQSTHLFQVLTNSSLLVFCCFFCQNGDLLHRWPGCVLVFHHGQGWAGAIDALMMKLW